MKTALYARISTGDQQTLPMQLEAMREYVEKRGCSIVKELEEVASGAGKKRPKRDELLTLAKQKKIDAIVVLRLDRWGRSLRDVITTLDELSNLDIVFVSISEAIDLSTPSGEAMAGFLAVLAQYERSLLSQRVKEGMQHAKSKGKHVGRPATAQEQSEDVERLFYKEKMSKSAISRKLGIGYGSVHRILEKAEAKKGR